MSGLSEDILLGLAHRNYEQEEENARASIASLLYHSGDSSAVTGVLASERIAVALIVWFRDHDLERFRQHAYLAAKAEWMYCEHNHPRMIARFFEFSPPPYLEREGNTTKHIEYWFLKTALLLRNAPGDWSRVIEGCDHILANPQRKAWDKYQIDYEIIRAMARCDAFGFIAAMNVLVSPKYQRKRNYELPFGFTEHFIGTQAAVYAKMAWYHGMEVEIDTPSIPRELLGTTPATSYPEPYPYVEQCDIEKPLEWQG